MVQQPSPAIVTQEGVRGLPRVALVLFCLAYVLPGFLFREAWKSVDLISLGFMMNLAQGGSDWWHPTFMGQSPELAALLPYWLGAGFIQLLGPWIQPQYAVRVPFIASTFLSMGGCWYAVFYLSKSSKAQPVAFAFGGEAKEEDYARTMADAALLALIASLGLALPSHEVTPMLIQLCAVCLAFCSLSMMAHEKKKSLLLGALSLLGLSLSGAPSLSLGMGLIGSALIAFDPEPNRYQKTQTLLCLVITALVALITPKELWQWRLVSPPMSWRAWSGTLNLLIWFTWPAWPLSLWTLWRWRHHWLSGEWSKHLMIPLSMGLLFCVSAILSVPPDRILLLSLPFWAALAAFALPTLQRSVSALIDWFTLIFFCGCAFIIWVVWLAMQTGWPAQPAKNVARLLPGFVPEFDALSFICALIATCVWIALVHWRVGRKRHALWVRLVLPAGGAALCWLLLMSLWLPLLDYARSYKPLVAQVQATIQPDRCVQVSGLGLAQISAFQIHSSLRVIELDETHPNPSQETCNWLLVESPTKGDEEQRSKEHWEFVKTIPRPSDDNQDMDIYHRRGTQSSLP
jgi:hypothetical protein